uniref:Uncharacterized protein n=1 Tax=Nelumbo nucifera TaxID=4432 RepID=A0A822YAE1_NELNU|nr:TPA_asm: hypothetical protein HUJ06_029433 [Nelumbo nucifera]
MASTSTQLSLSKPSHFPSFNFSFCPLYMASNLSNGKPKHSVAAAPATATAFTNATLTTSPSSPSTFGYARASGLPSVYIATLGPGATNLVRGLAGAMLDGVPLVAITRQVTRSITKHNYLVLDVEDIPHIVREAFYLASSGRPGPVLIDIIHQQPVILRFISESKKPVLYVGGGCLNSSEELKRFVELTGIPVASTSMGLGAYPGSDDLCLHMLGMYGTVYANYAVEKSDLLLAFGVRFDDCVTGKVEAFASRAKIPHLSIFTDVKLALEAINRLIKDKQPKLKFDFSAWRKELHEQKLKFPLSFKTFVEAIPPQYAIQHWGWAAQWYKYKRPHQWLTSGELGATGFGLPSAIIS